MGYTVSHFEIRVRDSAVMEKFYTEVLGFIVSDRGRLRDRDLVFLSHSPDEHHQIVLIPAGSSTSDPMASGIGHVAFRVDSRDEVKRVYERVRGLAHANPEPVSHGNTWSVYFRDPENNRIEIFAQTPWHTTQPCRFGVDYDQPDDALVAATEAGARQLAGFAGRDAWQDDFDKRFAEAPAE